MHKCNETDIEKFYNDTRIANGELIQKHIRFNDDPSSTKGIMMCLNHPDKISFKSP